MDIPWIVSLFAGFTFGWNINEVLIDKTASKRRRAVFYASLVVWLVCCAIGLSKHF
jgi:hypothetical protein